MQDLRMSPAHEVVLRTLRRLGGWRTSRELSLVVPRLRRDTICTALADMLAMGHVMREALPTSHKRYRWRVVS